MESEYGWKNVLLFVLSFLFGSFLILLLEILKNFIKSKPPGRRLVSGYDYQILHCWLLCLFSGGDCRCSRLPSHLAASVVRGPLSHGPPEGSPQQFLLLGNFLHHLDDHFSHGKGFLLYLNEKSFSVLKILIKNNFKAFPSCFCLNCEYFIFFASRFHVRYDCRHRKNGQSDTERMPHNNDPSDYCSFGHGIYPGTYVPSWQSHRYC